MKTGRASAILEIRDVSCALGGRPVLRHIDLKVEEGETVVLLGRSGSGKTTLLKTINGLAPVSAGEVRFEGRAAVQWDAVRMRRRMGYVIQDAGLFPHWTVEANIGLVPRLEKWEPARVAARVELLLAAVGLAPAEFRHRYPRQLSGGERQRWASRARWAPIRRCCSSTSRSPRSIPSRVSSCSGSYWNCAAPCGRPRCS